MKQWSNRLTRRAIQAFLPLTSCLSWRVASNLGSLMGRAAVHLIPRYRKRAEQHITEALKLENDPAAVKKMVKKVFENLGRSLFEFLKLTRMDREALNRWVSEEGSAADQLRADHQAGGGAILVTGHIGNWELLNYWLNMNGCPTTILVRANPDEHLQGIVHSLRSKCGTEVVSRDAPDVRAIIGSALDRGRILGVLMDLDTKVSGVFTDFFGKPAYTPIGPAVFALRRQIPVYLTTLERYDTCRHRLIMEGPLRYELTGDFRADVHRVTAELSSRLEQRIRKDPTSWIWMHRRWRTKPPENDTVSTRNSSPGDETSTPSGDPSTPSMPDGD